MTSDAGEVRLRTAAVQVSCQPPTGWRRLLTIDVRARARTSIVSRSACRGGARFAGYEFPPFIVFKIFHSSGGHGSRYITGKKIIIPSSEVLRSYQPWDRKLPNAPHTGHRTTKGPRKAAIDAFKLMGHRAYYEQMICDQLDHQKYRITDLVDVATFKDYMQYTSHLDEIPAHRGGRDNCWRRLSLKNMPRTTLMYDIMDYAESGTLSSRLKEEMKLLLQMPHSEDVQRRQLSAVTEIRLSSMQTLLLWFG
ncbi:unnamed protein product [Ranitomeya imitator]|uniref:Uncharacterized protein n=1 Tax=Ranitomeya imitator TaxID=111125 RepID=A0ABN9KZ20_9NEOB|nr:unnamed protein product [Ranitomeya imitator]